jgi:hypothetical protein
MEVADNASLAMVIRHGDEVSRDLFSDSGTDHRSVSMGGAYLASGRDAFAFCMLNRRSNMAMVHGGQARRI